MKNHTKFYSKTPKHGEKRWVRTKGAKNCAKMWREDMGMWVIVPMVPEREFKYVTPPVSMEKVPMGRKSFVIKDGYKGHRK
jgi:hypothetical protein